MYPCMPLQGISSENTEDAVRCKCACALPDCLVTNLRLVWCIYTASVIVRVDIIVSLEATSPTYCTT